jgi:sulfatase modifying factor 1
MLLAGASTASSAPPSATPAWIDDPGGSFAIMATEVPVAAFRECVVAGACDEATVNDACNFNREAAPDDRSDHPVNCVNFDGAEQYCAFAAARLCSQEEWLGACRGPEGRDFPYGGDFNREACNVGSSETPAQGRERGTSVVGSITTCEGGLPGLFDMAGNVNEWVADCSGTYCKFRGGAWLSNEPTERFAGCAGVCSGNQKTLRSAQVGFRCCRDLGDSSSSPAVSPAQ